MLKSMFIKFLNLSTIILVLLLGAGSFSSAYAQPDISVSPTSHNFGNVTEGNSSTPLTVTISNDGDGDLTITSLSITGTDLTEFSIDPDSDTCSGEIIAPAGDCTADITFDPATEGAKSANLSISSDDPNEDPLNISLTGTGEAVPPPGVTDISVSYNSHDFGDVNPGDSSTPFTIIISNNSTVNLTITSLSITGTDLTEFSIDPDSDTCSGEIIAPAGDCTADITFDPATEGAKSANLSISSDDPNEDPFDVSLLGTGVVPDISADPELLNFVDITVDTSSEPQEVLISNNGEGALEITDISITGLNKDEFSIYSSEECLGVTLLTGESCSVSVVFEPTSEGNKQAKLSIESDDPDENPLKLSLTGRGFVPCGNSPEIKTLSKSKGTYSDTVVIKGSGFCTDQGTVIFAKGTIGVEAEIDGDGWEDTKITVRVPWGCQVGKNKVKVITNYGTESATKPFKFLKPLLVITKLSLPSGSIASELEITGKNFGIQDENNSFVQFDKTKAEISEWKNDSIILTIPSIIKVTKKGKIVSISVNTIYGLSKSKKFKVLPVK
ncbi:MAG: hypothetical protein A3C43_04425 [Candidatus Schekmanbacteria bacterium RIFCSPHIGHO2_02_FULL_38_11]|nr:MAG: hypothetical protein A3C43_04425 [Candidatus Schekmanbacteria bacterium RIFCSPHIGHO2_02_FULL_38_11]